MYTFSLVIYSGVALVANKVIYLLCHLPLKIFDLDTVFYPIRMLDFVPVAVQYVTYVMRSCNRSIPCKHVKMFTHSSVYRSAA